jgi:long-chain fatty acid transport protein
MKTLGVCALGGGLALLATSWARDARGAGFAAARFGGEQGTPVSTNPTALYYNPAGIGFSDGVDLFADGNVAIRYATWSHTAPPPGPSEQPQSQAGNTGTARLLNVFGGPAIGATVKFGDLALGAGFFVPFGGRVSWSQNKNFGSTYPAGSTCAGNGACPLAADGVQRWHLIDASLTFIYGTIGAAYRLGPLSLGVAGNVIDGALKSTQAKTLAGNIDSTVEGRAAIDVSNVTGSFGAGVMLEAVPRHLWIGASYQAQPGLGPLMMTGTVTQSSGPAPYYSNSGSKPFAADFHQSLPDIFRAGIRLRTSDSFELRLFGDFTRWSVMTSQCVNLADSPAGTACYVHAADGTSAPAPGTTVNTSVFTNIPRNWKNTYGARIGMSYWVVPEVELMAGLGYETGATPDSTLEPGSPDADNIGAALGARFKVADGFYLACTYTHLQFVNRDNTGKSTLAAVNGVPVQQPTFQQDGGGQYTQWIGIADANIEASF